MIATPSEGRSWLVRHGIINHQFSAWVEECHLVIREVEPAINFSIGSILTYVCRSCNSIYIIKLVLYCHAFENHSSKLHPNPSIQKMLVKKQEVLGVWGTFKVYYIGHAFFEQYWTLLKLLQIRSSPSYVHKLWSMWQILWEAKLILPCRHPDTGRLTTHGPSDLSRLEVSCPAHNALRTSLTW